MRQDIFGQDTTLDASDALEAWNDTMLAFMAHGATTPEHLAKTLERAPDFAMAHAAKGLFCLLLGRQELNATAEQALRDARRAVAIGQANARERAYVETLAAYCDGAPTRAVASLEGVLDATPRDALAAKLSHAIRFIMGDANGMRLSIEAVMAACGSDHPAHGYLKGCHAFALEETGDYAAAECAGREGLDAASDDAWGLHAVAHVYDMTGNAKAGLDWLEGREAAFAHCNNFRYHVWWHKALMHLDCGDLETALALYDTEIRSDKTDDYRDISNAASLLSRLELEGVAVGDRWEELAELSMARAEDGCLIFADLHYLLALVGGQREDAIATLTARLYRDARAAKTEAQQRMARPGLSTAAGLTAFGEGDYAAAFRHLVVARKDLQRAGGSHAQRDVFDRLCIDAGLRAGQLDAAEAVLEDRRDRRGHDDGYTIARRSIISEGRRIPAE
ncbi:MAG: tetratricopeptide repeat protein [Pseudomonadota bacterium]